MKIYYEKGDIFLFFAAFGLCIFATFADFLYVVIPSSIIQGGIGLFILLCELYLIIVSNQKLEGSNIWIGLFVVLMGLFLIHNNGWETVKTVVYFVSVLLVVVSQNDLRITIRFIKISFCIYLFYAFCTYYMFFNKDFYLNHVVDLFESSRNMLINLYNSGNMAGLTAHYSTNAMLISAGFLIVMCNYIATKRRASLYLSIFMFIALLMTGKRAHVLFSVISLYITYYVTLSSERKRNRVFYVFGSILLIIGIIYIISVYVPALGNSIFRLRELSRSEDTSVTMRYTLWAIAIGLFKQNPIIGIGWKQFPETAHIVSKNFTELTYYDAHNIYVQLLCETGIVGSLVYVCWFVYNYVCILRANRYYNLNHFEETEVFLIRFSLAYQLFFMMYGLTGNPLYETITFIPYFISCGIGLYYGHSLMFQESTSDMVIDE